MTDQYNQNNINRPVSGARIVTQADIDTTIPIIAVVLNNDDDYVLCGTEVGGVAYQVNLPDVRENPGRDIVLKNVVGGVVVAIAPLPGQVPAQTIEGGGGFPTGPGDSVILRADPPDLSTDPATPATNWSQIKIGAP